MNGVGVARNHVLCLQKRMMFDAKVVCEASISITLPSILILSAEKFDCTSLKVVAPFL